MSNNNEDVKKRNEEEVIMHSDYTVDDLTPDLEKLLNENVSSENKNESKDADNNSENVAVSEDNKEEVELFDVTPIVEEVKAKLSEDINKIDKEIDALRNISDDDLMVDVIAESDDDTEDEKEINKKLEDKKKEINAKLSILTKKRAELENELAVEATKKIIEKYAEITKDNGINYDVACEIYSKLNDDEKKKFNELNQKHPFKALDFIREKIYAEMGVKKVGKDNGNEERKIPTRIEEIRGGVPKGHGNTVGGFSQKDYKEMGII